MAIKFTRMPEHECIAVATMLLEGFAPGHRSLDVLIYACAAHEDDAWENWGFSELWKYRKEYQAKGEKTDHRCGDLVDFREENSDEATADASMPRDPVELEEQIAAEHDEDQEENTVPSYHLTVNGKTRPSLPLQEVRAAVAELVTNRLEKAPERLALDAQTVNMAFNSGAVEQSLEERGEWYTVFDAYGEDPARIRVIKEG